MPFRPSLAYVDAQNEYADQCAGTGAGTYAQRILSQAGKKDGLYWPRRRAMSSPLGELVAGALRTAIARARRPAPYHGYYYKVLTRQGPDAPGGAANYVVRRQDDRRLRAGRLSGGVR